MTHDDPTYGYLGPAGTFTQAALRGWIEQQTRDAAGAVRPASDEGAAATAPAAGASTPGEASSHPHQTPSSSGAPTTTDGLVAAALERSVPFATVPAALDAVRSGGVDGVMVPIENSVEGGVSSTLDALNAGAGALTDSQLLLVGEVLVPITFVLAARPGTRAEQITGVGSHSHAWPQVRGWMASNLPQATYVPTLSTAAAAQSLADDAAENFQAAVCAPMAADVFGLETLATHIGDNAGAVTRFVLVTKARDAAGRPRTPAPTGHDKTTLVLYQHADRAGGLLELLEQFATRGISMSRLESRPTGEAMGSYCFSLDIEGHIASERVGEALMGLKRVAADVRYLGSYARADKRPVDVAPETSDEAFAGARAWLHALR